MITEKDLRDAIAECLGERNPNANTCIKLAAFYTIQNELFPKAQPFDAGMSFDAPPTSEFAEAVQSATPEVVWSVLEELMDTLRVLHPKLYNGVLMKLRA